MNISKGVQKTIASALGSLTIYYLARRAMSGTIASAMGAVAGVVVYEYLDSEKEKQLNGIPMLLPILIPAILAATGAGAYYVWKSNSDRGTVQAPPTWNEDIPLTLTERLKQLDPGRPVFNPVETPGSPESNPFETRRVPLTFDPLSLLRKTPPVTTPPVTTRPASTPLVVSAPNPVQIRRIPLTFDPLSFLKTPPPVTTTRTVIPPYNPVAVDEPVTKLTVTAVRRPTLTRTSLI
jgi:hypothetical protein